MPKTIKIAFLKMRVDATATKPPDDALERFFLASGDGSALLEYWSASTMKHLDFTGSKLMPWVDLSITAAELGDRAKCHSKAVAAAKAANQDLSGFDAIVAVYHPGAGVATGGFENSSDAVLSTSVNHTYAVHELGHVLRADHSWGLPNLGDDWDGAPWILSDVYGDPYDIMSAETFAARDARGGVSVRAASPTFTRADLATAIPGWPTASSWNSMGPAPARAIVHLNWPDALKGQVVTTTRGANGWKGRFALRSAGLLESGKPALVVLDDTLSTPARRWTIELRGCHGWDRGLETTGADLARRAVVVHEIVTTSTGAKQGWYRGRVLVPLEGDTDVSVPNANLVVRVVEAASDGTSAIVELASMSKRSAMLEADVSVEEKVLSRENREVNLSACGTQSLPWTVSDASVTAVLRARTTGYGADGDPDAPSPLLRWRIGGSGLTTAGTGTITVLGQRGGATPEAVKLDYELRDAMSTLILKSRVESTPFTVEVTVTASEPDGSDATASAPFELENPGHQEGFGAELLIATVRCRSRLRMPEKWKPWFESFPAWLRRQPIRPPRPEPPGFKIHPEHPEHPVKPAHGGGPAATQADILLEAESIVRPSVRVAGVKSLEYERPLLDAQIGKEG